jgi:hypothetical protein
MHMTRKELTADIKKRVAAGESKRAIFSRYSMTEWEEAASRIHPLQVTLAKRKRWRFLNWALVGCLSVITLFTIVDIIFMSGSLNSAGARIGIVMFGLAINVAVLVGVIRYSGIAYMITSILILQGFAKILEADALKSLESFLLQEFGFRLADDPAALRRDAEKIPNTIASYHLVLNVKVPFDIRKVA